MKTVWEFVLLGLGSGAIYVLAAHGLVLIQRGSGVINFAQTVFALVGAYAMYEVQALGAPVVLAVVVGVVVAGGSGALTYLVIMRPLSGASQLTRVIATLGLFTLASSLFTLHFGDSVILPQGLINPANLTTVLGVQVSQYSLLILAIALVVTGVLMVVYRFTLFGLRTTAVAENATVAATQGTSPTLVALWNWSAGAALGGLSGALIAPILGVNVSTIALLIVPSLAAGLFGRFTSFGLTCAGGLLIGIGESELTRYNIGTGWSQAFPFVVIIVVLVFRGRGRLARGEVNLRLPAVGDGRVRAGAAAGAVVVLAILMFTLHQNAVTALTSSLALGVVFLSWVVITGYTGQISLAQWSLAGVGAFIAARLAGPTGLNFLLLIVIAAVITLPIGFLFGIPALRTRGVTLAIVTLGLGFMVQAVIFGNENLIGGVSGITLPTPTLFGIDFDPTIHPERYGTLCLVITVVVALGVANLRRSRIGRRLVAVRGNERAAASVGISVIGVKLYAFTLASGIAALGGGLLLFQNSQADFSNYTVTTSIALLTVLVVGGSGYIGGAVFASVIAAGGILAFTLSVYFTSSQVTVWLAAASGLAVLITVIRSPDGAARQMGQGFGDMSLALRGRGPARRLLDEAPEVPMAVRDPHSLEVSELTVHFGGVVALDGVSLSVRSGQIVGLIGPNGAGKTTLIDVVSGMTSRYRGQVSFDGAPLDRASAAERSRRGVVRSFQALELFDDLTVLENLKVASEEVTRWSYARDLFWPRKLPVSPAAALAIDVFELAGDLHRKPEELPYARRRLVGIARAVAADPAVLLLDEPAAGLDDVQSAELARLLRALADRGLAILLVEHDMNLVMGVSDTIVALNFGRVIATGSPDHVRHDPAVVDAYLGAVHTAVDGRADDNNPSADPGSPARREAISAAGRPTERAVGNTANGLIDGRAE